MKAKKHVSLMHALSVLVQLNFVFTELPAATDITIAALFFFFFIIKEKEIESSTTNVSTVRRCCYLTGQRCSNSATRVGLMSRMRL